MRFSVTMMLGAVVVLSSSVACAALPGAADTRSGKDLTINTNLPPAMWTGPMSDGKNVTLYGHALSIQAQLKKLDPHWVPNPVASTSGMAVTMDNHTAEHSTLMARGNGLTCCPVGHWNWWGCPNSDMNNAINSLGGLSGSFWIPPNSCANVASSGFCGIWFCNDNNYNAGLGAADMQNAVHAMGSCFDCGQLFLSGGINVITHSLVAPFYGVGR